MSVNIRDFVTFLRSFKANVATAMETLNWKFKNENNKKANVVYLRMTSELT